MELVELLSALSERNGSDLHVKHGSPPFFRVDGELFPFDHPPIGEEEIERSMAPFLSEKQLMAYGEGREVDFAATLPGLGRFRVNLFKQRGKAAFALRRVLSTELTIEKLGLPEVIKSLADEPRGLILVTGTAGSGKTSTLAAIVNHINSTRHAHVVTIEDPIEVVHEDNLSMIEQREIGLDTDSYAAALKNVVRQDPNVILVGEMRDAETVGAALSAAEIGNLVLSTLHTVDATETINRIVDFFKPHHQKQIRLMLASTLRGVISQRLLSKIGGGRVVASEIMITSSTIKECIANEALTSHILEAIEEGEYYGMHSFDQSLLRLYVEGKIALEDALANCANAHDFKLKVRSAGVAV